MSSRLSFDILNIPVPKGFNLTQTVCSYGFFTQQPNIWVRKVQGDPDSALFRRQLLLSDETAFHVQVAQGRLDSAGRASLHVKADRPAVDAQLSQINLQVCRMFRMSSTEERRVQGFQELHSRARSEGFGRLFRSPTIWEDLLKSILLCNCGWTRTLAMNKALCASIGHGAFPSPAMLVSAGAGRLQSECGLGYRARTLLRLAEQVVSGDTDLAGLEDPHLSSEQVYQKLLPLPGVGPFTAANMLQLLGHYDRIPCDSETVRHLRKVHKLSACTQANVQQHAQQVYAKYAPYQFLAYWHELWREYEALVGSFEDLAPESYTLLTGHNMRRAAQKSDRLIAEASAAQSQDGGDEEVQPLSTSKAGMTKARLASAQLLSQKQQPARKRAKLKTSKDPPKPSSDSPCQAQGHSQILAVTDEVETSHASDPGQLGAESSSSSASRLRQHNGSPAAHAGRVKKTKKKKEKEEEEETAVGTAKVAPVRRSQRVATLQQVPVQ